MDAPEDANPITPPSPPHSEESLEFRYIDDELPPIKSDTPLQRTPFSDASKPDVPCERGLQIRSCEAGASYTYHPPHPDSSKHTPFSDAPKPDERGLQIYSCEAGASYTYHSSHPGSSELTVQANNALYEQLIRNRTLDDAPQDSSAYDSNNRCDFDEEQISSTIQRLVTSTVSEIEGPRCELECHNPINIADPPKGLIEESLDPTLLLRPRNFLPQLLPQSTFENLHSAVDSQHSQHQIRDQTSEPKAATETELMEDDDFISFISNLLNEGHSKSTRLCVLKMPSLDYDGNPMTSNVNSQMPIRPAIIGSHMNNACTSTRQPSQSNSAPSLDLSTSQHSHQTQTSSSYETPQRDLHHSQNVWLNQLDYYSESSSPILGEGFDYYSESSSPILGEGFNQNRFNKKRRKRTPVEEATGCKNCKCKKANCLKHYCKCFASGVYCMGPCFCQNCYNRPNHEDKVLAARKASEARNPLAFAPKVNRSVDSLSENGFDPNKTPTSTAHIRGCNCKKSNCEKKYCECYENGVGCSAKCRCTGCNNTFNVFGRDSSSSELGLENGTQINESSEKLMVENVSHPNSTATSPTPSWAYDRSNASLGGSSKRKRPSNFNIPDASRFNASQRLNETIDNFRNQLTFEDNLESNSELLMPNIEQVGDGSSTPNPDFTYINNSSNSAREMIQYHSSPPFSSPTPLQHPTPSANPTIPDDFVKNPPQA